jgi:hypothetical protein
LIKIKVVNFLTILLIAPFVYAAEYWPLIRVDYEHSQYSNYRNTSQYNGLNYSFRTSMENSIQEAKSSGVDVIVVSMYRPQYLQDRMRIHRISIDHPIIPAKRSNHTRRQAADIYFNKSNSSQWDKILHKHGLYRPLPIKDPNHITWLPDIQIPYEGAGQWSLDLNRLMEQTNNNEPHIENYENLIERAEYERRILQFDRDFDSQLEQIDYEYSYNDNNWTDNYNFNLDYDLDVDIDEDVEDEDVEDED